MQHQIHRDFVLGVGIIFAALLVAAAAFSYLTDSGRVISRPVAATTPPLTPVPFIELAHGSKSSVTERVNYLVTSKAELTQLWKMINSTTTAPSIDFNSQVVVAVFAGQQLVKGTDIAVAKVQDAAERLVSITIKRPQSTCVTKRATTTPFEVITVPRTSLSFTHEDIAATMGCPK